MLIRDVLRQKIAQQGTPDQLPIGNFDAVLKALAQDGRVVCSCGPASYAYAALAGTLGVPVEVVSFMWLKDSKLRGHTATMVDLEGARFVSDIHPGMVWQDSGGNLADPVELTRQLGRPLTSWEFYPSTHGQSSASHFESALRYVFGFWGYSIEKIPDLTGVIFHDVARHQSMRASQIHFYGKEEAALEAKRQITLDHSMASWFLNDEPWSPNAPAPEILESAEAGESGGEGPGT